jgi:hypothetical protein
VVNAYTRVCLRGGVRKIGGGWTFCSKSGGMAFPLPVFYSFLSEKTVAQDPVIYDCLCMEIIV